jgi:hydrogenase expression/formation protein HypC
MCLGVPGQVVELKSSREAVVDFWGVRKCVRLDQLDILPAVGDFIIDHAGAAVRVIPIEDVADTLALYEILLTEGGEDPIVRNTIEQLECEIEIEFDEPALV